MNIDFNDEKTWDLFKDGKTKGIFQLESNLGKAWSKKVQPKNIEELAALISLIRPGTLDRKSTRLNSSHIPLSRMPSSA